MTREEAVAEVKRRLDIVEFIGQYLTLKKAGINFSGICPFHQEKSPSFMVNPERQSFKCFGCGKGGDVITFMMEKEGLPFGEALELLAERTGVELPVSPNRPAQSGPDRSRLVILNTACQKLWHELLVKHPKAQAARDYLKRRGLSAELIDLFGLGFAPPTHTTREYLQKQGFTVPEQVAAGEPARFADRITFPITDSTGRIVGFTGRQLPAPAGVETRGPKYWNTPETAVFKKSEALFGLHLAKEAIREAEATILAEGQMDVIGLFAAGLKQTVATSGTALTERQTQILRRFAPEIVFCYDADEAGLKAAERGFAVALAADLNPTVMTLPAGTDPGDLGFSKPQTLVLAYENRQPVIAWLLNIAVEQYGTNQPTAKKAIVRRLLPWLAQVTDPIERRGWLDVVAERLKTTTGAIEEALAGAKKGPPPPQAEPTPVVRASETTLLFGLLGWHPTLLETLGQDNLARVTPPEWAAVRDWLVAAADARPALQREDELRLGEAVLSAEHQYGKLGLQELKHEISQLAANAQNEQVGRRKRELSREIDAAVEAGDDALASRLLEELKSVNLKPLE